MIDDIDMPLELSDMRLCTDLIKYRALFEREKYNGVEK